ncbi:YesL family protein [Agrobacterium vitis]|uniref:DUF624 domain-containing protein n=1 Tax=Agrobacterium vitis TaxID=373 RepID=A0AAE5AXA5_AGRVI|nr:DUF624 domain-containing protein [Agrobacterium vitis]MCF1500951.1 DUF624 domain-containing protein [Allorhizobium sp. Av2]MCM2442409.1 YesL family protein [Agrobacterium vitis]MUZ60263.1 DUF624 domain-containing protein [Agrobacterium vitis]MVA67636.1 DUF624 domain-containing protein [Agrobacterium vitis]MVA89841.1 DUF624 domain-containing protein [Agrobacterium vitis]
MQWLEAIWTKEGKGIAKDAPKRTGLALFCEIIGREWWELVKLNLLFLVAALPIVTLPAALFATASVCRSMVEDRNVYLLRDFIEAFRRYLAVATAWGLATALALWIGFCAISTYGAQVRDSLIYAGPLAVSLVATGFVGVWSAHFIVLAVMSKRGVLEILRLSALATLLRPLPTMAALMFVAALWLVHVLLYPVSVFMPAMINFSLGMFAISFGAHRAAVMVLNRPDAAYRTTKIL